MNCDRGEMKVVTVKMQRPGGVGLMATPVHLEVHIQILWIGQLVACDQPGADRPNVSQDLLLTRCPEQWI